MASAGAATAVPIGTEPIIDHPATGGFIDVIITIIFVVVGHAERREIARVTTVIFVPTTFIGQVGHGLLIGHVFAAPAPRGATHDATTNTATRLLLSITTTATTIHTIPQKTATTPPMRSRAPPSSSSKAYISRGPPRPIPVSSSNSSTRGFLRASP